MTFRKGLKSTYFFKVILQTTLEEKKLIIPQKFVRLYGDELTTDVKLRTPQGQVWKMGLTKHEKTIFFDDGWHEFAEHHSLEVGHFVVFKYKRNNSSFNVTIFDPTACEIEKYLYTDQRKQFESPKPHANTLHDQANSKSQHRQCNVAANSSCNPEKKTEFDIDNTTKLTLLKEMNICVARNFTNLATEDKERAISAARLFKPKKPSFMVIIRASDIVHRHFYVPVEFGRRYFRQRRNLKLLDCEGRKWLAGISWSARCHINGLGKFSQYLDEGDVCVLELISRKKLKVSILKKVQESDSE